MRITTVLVFHSLSDVVRLRCPTDVAFLGGFLLNNSSSRNYHDIYSVLDLINIKTTISTSALLRLALHTVAKISNCCFICYHHALPNLPQDTEEEFLFNPPGLSSFSSDAEPSITFREQQRSEIRAINVIVPISHT